MQPTPATERAAARSYLFVPGDRPDRFDKAWESCADEIIVDLEDAVSAGRKTEARAAVSSWLDPSRPVWIRLNAVDTSWFVEDVALGHRAGVAGLMLPKAEAVPQFLIEICAERGIGLLPLIESAAGLRACGALAAIPGVVRLAFGALDFQLDLGVEGDDALLAFRSQLVIESRLAGVAAPIDSVTTAVHDAEQVRNDARRARQLGFGAKLCIHPQQAVEVNRVFSPSDEERRWANRVLEAMQASAGAAASLDGKMIDRPVWIKAARIAAAPAFDRRLRR